MLLNLWIVRPEAHVVHDHYPLMLFTEIGTVPDLEHEPGCLVCVGFRLQPWLSQRDSFRPRQLLDISWLEPRRTVTSNRFRVPIATLCTVLAFGSSTVISR